MDKELYMVLNFGMNSPEYSVVVLFVGLFSLELAIELFLNEANLRYAAQHGQSQHLPQAVRDRLTRDTLLCSVKYTLAKGAFERWSLVYRGAIKLTILFGGVLGYLDRLSQNTGGFFPASTQATGILFCLAISLLVSVLNLFPDLYYTFVLEERFGFNKTSLKLFLNDKAKGFFVGIAVGVPLLFMVLVLMQAAGPHWWLYAFVFILGFQLLLVVLYPTVIAPLFNKFTPLEESELRQRVMALATQLGFQTSGIFTMDGSRRSAHSNAYFTGLGRSKRIVFFDTLLEQTTIEQVVAVLAHEIGHYKLKHVRKMLLLQSALLLVALYVISLLLHYEPFYRAFGLASPSYHGALVLFALVAGPFTFYLNPLLNLISRKHEYDADRYAARHLGDGTPMAEALINLSSKNLSNLTPHPWYSAYHYSHPCVTERVQAILGREAGPINTAGQ